MVKELHDSFVRQRRSLILISIVLTILVWFGINGTEVRVGPGGGAGLTLDLLDTRLIYLGLYLMWGWFVYRYWQYVVPARVDSKIDLDNVQLARIEKYFQPLMVRKAKETYHQYAMRQHPEADEVKVSGIGLSNYAYERWIRVSCTAKSVLIKMIDGKDVSLGEIDVIPEITGWRLYCPLLKAITPVNIKHPYFTEYLSPFVFAVGPLIAFVLRWESVIGSPVRALGGMWRLWLP